MESHEVLNTVIVSNGSVSSCNGGLERLGSGVKGSGSFGDELLEDLDFYWEDINDRLMISRMVSDSVIRGMIHAVEQEAAEIVAVKELEVASLKELLRFLDLGASRIDLCEPDSMKYGQHLSLSNDYVEFGEMRESLCSLRYAAKEQFNTLKKEIDGIRGCNSVRRINSGSELVGLVGILEEKENESWIAVDKTVGSLEMTVDTIITRVDGMLRFSELSLCKWRQEQDFQRDVEAVVMQSLIRSIQEESEEKLWEQKAECFGGQSVNWLEKFNEISSLRKELDVILKLLPNHEAGLLVSVGSGDIEHSHRVLNNHILSFANPHREGNGKVGEPESGASEVFDAAHIKHMSRDELVKHFNTIMRDYKRDHESTVQQMAEEIISLKGKILNERGSSLPNRKDKDFDILKKKIPEVISKLDGIIDDNEKLPSLCDSTLGSLRDRLDNLLLENHQLRGLLADKKNEVKCLTSQVSESAEKMLQHVSEGRNFSRQLAILKSSLEDTSIEASIRDEVYKCVLIDRFKSDYEESEMKSLIMQDIYGIIYGEATQSIKTGVCETEESDIESLIMIEISGCIFRECLKDAIGQVKEAYQEYLTEKESRVSLAKEVLEKENQYRSEVRENERLTRDVASLAMLVEEKEKLGMEVSATLVKKTEQFDLASQELTELRGQSTMQQEVIAKTQKDLDVVKGELNEALEQIKVNEREISILKENLELQMHKLEEADEQRKMAVDLSQAARNDLLLLEAKEKEHRKQMEAVILLVHALSEQFREFECKVAGDINANNSRLIYSKSQMSCLLVKAEMLNIVRLQYKERLERKCSDLKKAEAEVDLLGDEVETLLGLLEKIYIALDHYSQVLQHYPGVMEILKLIRRELGGETCKSA